MTALCYKTLNFYIQGEKTVLKSSPTTAKKLQLFVMELKEMKRSALSSLESVGASFLKGLTSLDDTS